MLKAFINFGLNYFLEKGMNNDELLNFIPPSDEWIWRLVNWMEVPFKLIYITHFFIIVQ